MSPAFVIIIALIVDACLGEPKKFHPLIGFGSLSSKYESRFNKAVDGKWNQFFLGLLGVTALVVPLVLLISALLLVSGELAWALEILIVYWAIGHKSLHDHIKPVYQALRQDDLNLARQQLAMIVSRDTDQLSQQQVTQATIETGLENGLDAIFAVMFWFCILGAPAVVFYRLINTLDAMWGYKTKRFEYFGKSAARIDDVLNWVPARLVALSYAILGNTCLAIKCWKNQASLLKSPNAGPVMTSGAGSLNVKLGGTSYYHGELVDKPFFGSDNSPEIEHILLCLRLIVKTILLWCGIILVLNFW